MTAESVLSALNSGNDGLSAAEAKKRLRTHDPNRLPEAPRHSAWKRFALQFHNILICVLLAAAAVTALLGQLIGTGVPGWAHATRSREPELGCCS